MRTHPDIGLVIADLLQLVRFWLCNGVSHCIFKNIIFIKHSVSCVSGVLVWNSDLVVYRSWYCIWTTGRRI